MFINGEGLQQLKELEKLGHSEVKTTSEAASKDTIFAATPDKKGDIKLEDGKSINVDDLTKKIAGVKDSDWKGM